MPAMTGERARLIRRHLHGDGVVTGREGVGDQELELHLLDRAGGERPVARRPQDVGLVEADDAKPVGHRPGLGVLDAQPAPRPLPRCGRGARA